MRRLTLGIAIVAPLVSLALLAAGAKLLAAAVFLAGGAIVMTPVFRPNLQWLGPVITHFETAGRELWLTIDDGFTADTGEVLALLERHGVPATFFVKGTLADPSWIAAVQAAGHTVGNHSHTHPSGTFWCLPPASLAWQIDSCSAAIPPTTLFRAPVGMKNPFVHPLLAQRNLQLIGFSARAFDAVVQDPVRISARIEASLEPGAIVVLHQGRPWSIAAIERTIERAKALGYSFVIPSPDRLKTKR